MWLRTAPLRAAHLPFSRRPNGAITAPCPAMCFVPDHNGVALPQRAHALERARLIPRSGWIVRRRITWTVRRTASSAGAAAPRTKEPTRAVATRHYAIG